MEKEKVKKGNSKTIKKGKGKNTKKKNSNTLLIILAVVLIAIMICMAVYNVINKDYVKSVNKVLSDKYYNIECIDSDCSAIVAYKGDETEESKVVIINSDGNKIASYTQTYNEDDETYNEPYQVGNDYFIMREIDKSSSEVVSYSINNKNGKEIYSTENMLHVLNGDYLLMTSQESEVYTILDKQGNTIYDNISYFEKYLDGDIISIRVDEDYILLDYNIEKIMSGYNVDKEVSDLEDVVYLIIKNYEDGTYYYFDIDKNKIIGDGFQNYTMLDDEGNALITKSENGKNVKYVLNADGKQEETDEYDTQVNIVSDIKKNLDSKYYLYTMSVKYKNQEIVLVDNYETNQFGTLNLDDNTFTAIYNYTEGKTDYYSSIDQIDSDSDVYYQITCNVNSCDVTNTIVYDLNNQKVLYENKNNELILQYYIQYEDGYKVIKYSTTSSNTDYKGKYVLYDESNTEITKSSNEIVIIDKDVLFGPTSTSSLLLYSVNNLSIMNSDDNLASIETISGEQLYIYTDSQGNTIILDDSANEVASALSSNLNYGSNYIVYIEDNLVNSYNMDTKDVNTYELQDNEEIADAYGNIILTYKNSIFINNSTDNYFRIVTLKGKEVKKIKNMQIYSVKEVNNGENVFIITKNTDSNLYGLYLAK